MEDRDGEYQTDPAFLESQMLYIRLFMLLCSFSFDQIVTLSHFFCLRKRKYAKLILSSSSSLFYRRPIVKRLWIFKETFNF